LVQPTAQSYLVFDDLSRRASEQIRSFRDIVARNLPQMNEKLLRSNIPLIGIDLPTREPAPVSDEHAEPGENGQT
jgi:hypothetical protein